MIITKTEIGGVEYSNYRNLQVKRSISDYNSTSRFNVTYDSPFGKHASDFTVGNSVVIYADDSDASTKLFSGIVEKIKFYGKGINQTVTLSGRDYSLRLMDSTVNPIVYSNEEISEIVKSIIKNNVSDISLTNVNTTTTTLSRIAFNQTSAFEAIKQLADLAGYYFYVDHDQDLHFEEQSSSSSGLTLDNSNVLKMKYNQTREEMFNKVWVYGDRMLAGYKETNSLNGSAWGGEVGSVYTLLNRPHNTLIEYLGNPLVGGIYEIGTIKSGIDYLVNFFDKEIVFISGTDMGNSVPASGGSIVSIYDREIPIVKYGQDNSSISLYGPKSKVIDDKTIKDPTQATDILNKQLEKTDPFKGMEIELKGWQDMTPGNTAVVTLADFGIDETVGIISIDYNFDKNTVQSENVIKVKLSKKILDITDEINTLKMRIESLEAVDRKEDDALTRLETATGSTLCIGSYWEVKTRTLGSSFILSKGPHGETGDTFGGILGSVIASGVNFLGNNRSGFTVNFSGGFY